MAYPIVRGVGGEQLVSVRWGVEREYNQGSCTLAKVIGG